MTRPNDKIEINARIQIDSATLQTIVARMKEQVGPDAKGIYRVDTAEAVNRLITDFLEKNDFDAYVRDAENYANLSGPPNGR